MADIRLTQDQQQQLENLTAAIGQDVALRERLQADPRAVFGEYGLAELLPGEGKFDVNIRDAEVTGYAPTQPHIDYIVHRDVTIHADDIIKAPFQIGPTTTTRGTIG